MLQRLKVNVDNLYSLYRYAKCLLIARMPRSQISPLKCSGRHRCNARFCRLFSPQKCILDAFRWRLDSSTLKSVLPSPRTISRPRSRNYLHPPLLIDSENLTPSVIISRNDVDRYTQKHTYDTNAPGKYPETRGRSWALIPCQSYSSCPTAKGCLARSINGSNQSQETGVI